MHKIAACKGAKDEKVTEWPIRRYTWDQDGLYLKFFCDDFKNMKRHIA